MMTSRLLPCVVALLATGPVLSAQRADTTATKTALLAADSALAQAVLTTGATAFLDRLDPDAAVLFPGQPILRGAGEARDAFLARYGAPSSYVWTPAHAVASTDGRFGCTIGFSRSTSSADTTHAEHRGVYATCWRRSDRGTWQIVGHQRNDGPVAAAGAASPTLHDAPHSATHASGSDPRTAAQQADAAFATLGSAPAGPGPAFAHYAAVDALLLGGAGFPRGPEQIAAGFAQYPPSRVIAWEPARTFGTGSGGLAFTVGHSTNGPREGQNDGGPTTRGKYLTVWRQEPDGRWLYVFDLGSPR